LGCNTAKDNAYQKETKIFSNYLEEKFHEALAKDSVNYFVFSENGCPGCMKRANAFYQKNHKHNVYIMSKQFHEKYFNFFHENILIDSSGKINRLKYHGGNIGIIQVAHQQVYNIIYVEASTIDSIYNKLN